MNRKQLLLSATCLMASSTAVNAALSSGALLAFDPGVTTASGSGITTVVSGSYFSVDGDGDRMFVDAEDYAIAPGTDGGLLLGQTQLAANSHSGVPDGSEIAPFDAPWLFWGSTGMHQSTSPVTIVSDDGSGNAVLDFTGWSAIWNGVYIDLGGDSVNFGDTGQAIVSCDVDCSYGDRFTLDYTATIPVGDPSGLGGIYWGLHLEGVVTPVPVPASIWLFASGLIGLFSIREKKKLMRG